METINLDIYKKQINDLREQIRPYTEVGRGVAGFTKQQAQDFNRLNYKIKQLENRVLSQETLINQLISRIEALENSRKYQKQI